jgi:hypothetical protein
MIWGFVTLFTVVGVLAFLRFAMTKSPERVTCEYARVLYHNRLISIEELNVFMRAHQPCPKCIKDEDADSTLR